ncbi:hypothetical protein WDU94_015437 [Cyamophila willieti]
MEAGEPSAVNCLILSGDQPMNISWLFNAAPFPPAMSDISISQSNKKLSMLSILAVTHEHVGNYSCVASNLAGTSVMSASLLVNVPPKIQPFTFGEDSREAGDSVSSVCQLTGDLPMNITWLMNGIVIPGGSGSETEESPDISVSQTGRRMSMLAIEAVKHTHAGNYTCFAVNQGGNASYSAELKVNVSPKIQPFSFGEEPREAGESTSVTCMLTGDLPMNITWLMNGILIPGGSDSEAEESPDISVSQTGRRMSMLAIEAVKHTHAGNYTCFAVNQAGNASYSAELKVNVSPKIQPFSFGDEPREAGDTASVSCLLTGDIPMNITWLMNGKVCPSSSGSESEESPDISVSQTGRRLSMLAIEAVKHTHAGNYTCFAVNQAGNASYSAELKVNG